MDDLPSRRVALVIITALGVLVAVLLLTVPLAG